MGQRFGFPGCLTCLLIFLLAAGPGLADTAAKANNPASPGRVMFVLDASGSMWGQIKGKAKITIAKEVMKKLVDGLPAGMLVGLSAYGHRRKGDCQDIETLIQPGPLNRPAFKARVDAISPKGKTPLSEAVRQAALAMRYTEERATVVLVSDGLETCHSDPCALAAELAKAGVEFTVHVIGFNISKDEQERLRCLADRTGGLFLSADDAAGLHAALAKTVEKVKEPPKPVVPDPGKATLQGPAQVPVGQAFEVKWIGPDSKGDFVALAPKGSKDSDITTYAYTRTGNPLRLTAPGDTGDFELRYVHGQTGKVIGRAAIKITPVPAQVEPPASAQAAQIVKVKWRGPGYRGDYITIAAGGQRPAEYQHYTYVSQGNPLSLQAPAIPGDYEVRYILKAGDKLLAKAPIRITPATAQVKAPASARAAQKIKVAWQGPGGERDYVSIARPDQAPSEYLHYTHARTGNPLSLQMPATPGKYEIRYMQGLGDKLLAKTVIEITAVSASLTAPAAANAGGLFKVGWQGPGGERDYVSIARPDQAPNEYLHYTYTRSGNPLFLQAPPDPGKYEIRYMQGQGNKLLAKAALEIKAVSAGLTAPAAANMGSLFKVGWQGPGGERDYICISRPEQAPGGYLYYTYTRSGNPLSLQAPPDPGKYEIRYMQDVGRKILAKAAIEIKPVTAGLTPPATAPAGGKIPVTWQGPANRGDYITIARPGQPPRAYVHYAYTRAGNPLSLQAPAQPGQYEIRYIMEPGAKLLARKFIKLTKP